MACNENIVPDENNSKLDETLDNIIESDKSLETSDLSEEVLQNLKKNIKSSLRSRSSSSLCRDDAATAAAAGTPTSTTAAPLAPSCDEEGAQVKVKCVYKRERFEVSVPLKHTIAQFKEIIQTHTGLNPALQKLAYKGQLNDNDTLESLSVKDGAKFIVIGSTLKEILSVAPPSTEEPKSESRTSLSLTPLSKQKMHQKIIEKGKPDDVMVGIKDCYEALPLLPITGMINQFGHKVRLTFKLEQDELWISTKEKTQKISMTNITTVISESIIGHEEYHIMALQLGTTQASRYWVYWIPAQYVNAIKKAILY